MAVKIMSATEIKEILLLLVPSISLIVVAGISVAKPTIETNKIRKLKNKIRLLTEIPLVYKNGFWFDKDGLPADQKKLAFSFLPTQVNNLI